MAMMKQLLFVALVVLIVAGKAPVSLAFFLLQLTLILTLIPFPFLLLLHSIVFDG